MKTKHKHEIEYKQTENDSTVRMPPDEIIHFLQHAAIAYAPHVHAVAFRSHFRWVGPTTRLFTFLFRFRVTLFSACRDIDQNNKNYRQHDCARNGVSRFTFFSLMFSDFHDHERHETQICEHFLARICCHLRRIAQICDSEL